MFRPCFLATLCLSAPASAAPRFDWPADADAAMTAHIEAGTYQTVTSVLILKDGQPVYEHYFQGKDATSLHDTRSATKTVVSMAFGAALQEGLVSGTDVKVARYFSDYEAETSAEPRKGAITAEDLMTMSGPLECDDWNNFSRGNEERMYLVDDWTGFFWSLPLRGFPAWEKPPAEQPFGRAYSYCTAGVQLMGTMLGRAAQMPFPGYVESRIFAPAGISGFKWQYNGKGEAHMGGGLLLTTTALGKLGELERTGGMAGTKRVFSADWAKRSITPHAEVPGGTWQYGYLWWLQNYEVAGKTYMAAAMNGNGGNRVWVLPDFGLTVVLTKTDFGIRGMHEAAQAFFDTEILPHLVDAP